MTDQEKKDFIRDLHKNLYTYAGSASCSKYYTGFVDAANDISDMDFVGEKSYCEGYLAGAKCHSIAPDIKIEDFKSDFVVAGAAALKVQSYVDEIYRLTGAEAEDNRYNKIMQKSWALGFKDFAIADVTADSKAQFITRMHEVFTDDECSDMYYYSYTSGYKAAIIAMGKDKVEEEESPVKEDNTSYILPCTTVRWKGHDGIYKIIKELYNGFYLIEKIKDTDDISGNSYTSYSYAGVAKDELEIVNEI